MAISPEVRNQLLKAFLDPAQFSRSIIGRPLRSYQVEPIRQIANVVTSGKSRTFSVMMSRQAGKNELSAHLEAYLMSVHQNKTRTIVKVAPTFRPQIVNSITRLEEMFTHPLFKGKSRTERGYIVRLAKVNTTFLSAQPGASVVGATADLLMEFDEAQDIDPFKHDRDFVPMTASTNAPRVYYGTSWDDSTLLERVKQNHLQMTQIDGHPRHFEYAWPRIAEEVPRYGDFVQAERDRLGADHPIFKTQYELKTISGAGRFLTDSQLALMRGGQHPPPGRTQPTGYYVAGIDVAGEDEEDQDAALRRRQPRRDSTVVTIGRVSLVDVAGSTEPRVEVVAPLLVDRRIPHDPIRAPHGTVAPQVAGAIRGGRRNRRRRRPRVVLTPSDGRIHDRGFYVHRPQQIRSRLRPTRLRQHRPAVRLPQARHRPRSVDRVLVGVQIVQIRNQGQQTNVVRSLRLRRPRRFCLVAGVMRSRREGRAAAKQFERDRRPADRQVPVLIVAHENQIMSHKESHVEPSHRTVLPIQRKSRNVVSGLRLEQGHN